MFIHHAQGLPRAVDHFLAATHELIDAPQNLPQGGRGMAALRMETLHPVQKENN
jgi:hypothetical protein